MVDISLLQSLSYVAAAIGVCAAAVYYVSMLRNAERDRRRQALMLRMPAMNTQYYETYFSVLSMKEKTPEEWFTKFQSDSMHISKIFYLMQFYNILGMLYAEGLMRIEEVCKIAPPYGAIMLFERFWFLTLLNRKNYLGEDMAPDFFVPFERLYREMKRRYPKLVIYENASDEERSKMDLDMEGNVWSKITREKFLESVLK